MSALEKIKQQTKRMKEKAAQEFEKLPQYLEKKVGGYKTPKKASDKKKLDKIEEESRVRFFRKILKTEKKLDDDELTKAFNEFAELGDVNRKKLVSVFTQVLGRKALITVLKEIVDGKNSEEVLKTISNPDYKELTKKTAKYAREAKEVINEVIEDAVFNKALDRISAQNVTDYITGYDIFAIELKQSGVEDITATNRQWKSLSDEEKTSYNTNAKEINAKKIEQIKTRKKTIVLDDEIIPSRTMRAVDDTQTLRPSIDDLQCVYDYMKHIWIDDYHATYITSPTDTPLDSKYIITDTRFDKNNKFIYDDKEWYRPSKYFYMMQCGRYQDIRRQEGVVFTCFDGSEDLPVSFVIGYKTIDNDFVVQDEAIFDKEKKWLARKLKTQYDRHSEFVNMIIPETNTNIKTDISNKMRAYLVAVINPSLSNDKKDFEKKDNITTVKETIAEDKISPAMKEGLENVLGATSINISASKKSQSADEDKKSFNKKNTKIEPFDMPDPVYTPNSPFIVDLENAIMLRSVNKKVIDYIREIVNFTAFVDTAIFGLISRIFRSRLRASFYNPNMIPSLEIKQKLPEIFENKDITNKDEYMVSIESAISKKADYISYHLYNSIFTSDVITNIPPIVTYIPSFPDVNLPVSNGCDIPGFPSFEIVYYKLGEVTYCFTIYQLINMFQSNNFVNPYTGKEDFSKEFIDYIISFFNSKNVDIEFSKLFEETIVSVAPNISGYPMIEDLLSKLADIEASAFKEPEPVPDPLQPVETPQEVVEPKEEIKETFNETVEVKEEPKEEASPAKFGMDSRDVSDDIRCEMCGQNIENPEYRTILHDKDPKIVHFCNTKCFSNWGVGN